MSQGPGVPQSQQPRWNEAQCVVGYLCRLKLAALLFLFIILVQLSNRTSLQSQKQIADDLKRDAVAKIRVPDPKSSSESEEEEVAKPIASKSQGFG